MLSSCAFMEEKFALQIFTYSNLSLKSPSYAFLWCSSVLLDFDYSFQYNTVHGILNLFLLDFSAFKCCIMVRINKVAWINFFWIISVALKKK